MEPPPPPHLKVITAKQWNLLLLIYKGQYCKSMEPPPPHLKVITANQYNLLLII